MMEPLGPGSTEFQADGLQLPHHLINIKGILPLTSKLFNPFLASWWDFTVVISTS